MNPIWETTTRIRAFDVDANNRLKVSAIFDYFQDAASNDAERLDFGYKVFIPLGLFWVLSWMKVEFIDYPGFMEEIKIQSWGKKQHKLYSVRDYLMLDSNGKIICKGTSAWLLLDIKTLRPKILTELYPDLKMFDNQDALTDLPQKIKPHTQLKEIFTTEIRYSALDLNQHTNNAKYIEFILDCYSKEFHKEHRVKSLTVSFNSETKYNDSVKLFKGVEKQESLTNYREAKNPEYNKIVFQSLIEWD